MKNSRGSDDHVDAAGALCRTRIKRVFDVASGKKLKINFKSVKIDGIPPLGFR